jgi:coenzyme F420-reducing hydrogenase delta subunit
MFLEKYKNFQRFVQKQIPVTGKKPVSEEAFDQFIATVLANDSLDVMGKIYCRDGFAFVKEIDKHTYQILAFQINTFGEGAFGDKIKKLCTPLMITIKTHSTHFYSGHTLKDTNITFEDFYIGQLYSGSKGPLCDRDTILHYCRELFVKHQVHTSYRHGIIYKLISANFICHHVAETLSYALGALDLFWYTRKSSCYFVSGSYYIENRRKLKIEIFDNFSFERMRCYFEIPSYAKIESNDIKRFSEEYNLMHWEVNYKREIESFYLPAGFQKIDKKRFNKAANVITTQHIVEYLLKTYYNRMNTHIVSSTFQTLEYLSRAILAKMEGRSDEGTDFLKMASSCIGHYPDRDMKKIYEKQAEKFPMFTGDYVHSMFFRPPVI